MDLPDPGKQEGKKGEKGEIRAVPTQPLLLLPSAFELPMSNLGACCEYLQRLGCRVHPWT